MPPPELWFCSYDSPPIFGRVLLYGIPFPIQLYIPMVKEHVDGDLREIQEIKRPAQVEQPIHSSGGGIQQHKLADDAEDIADPDEKLKNYAFALRRAGGPGLANGNRPAQAKAQDHQCFQKVGNVDHDLFSAPFAQIGHPAGFVQVVALAVDDNDQRHILHIEFAQGFRAQIFQVIQSILKGDRVIAIVAPAFIGQFSGKVSPGKFVTAMKQLGFDRVMEVAIGADLCTIEEAKDFLEKVPEQQDYMATSCCPAWHSMIEKLYPGEMRKISMTLTPMVFTARMVKKDFPGCKVVFVGPCAAKKLEAIRADIRSDVDFVLTFEELQGMFEAKQIDFDTVEEQDYLNEGTSAGRGFAVSGGVAKAVTDLVHEQYPDMEIQTARAEGLRECRKLMMLAKAGKFKGCLLEGMACPGGCVAGAGTILPVDKAAKLVEKYSREAAAASPVESAYSDRGESLE